MTVVFDAIFIIHCSEVYKATRNNNNNVDLGCVISTEPPGNDLKVECSSPHVLIYTLTV